MDMRDIGRRLAAERKNRGLSLDDIMEKTKISRRNLIAIEEGRADELPHPVYTKGFIRNYAAILDLDPEEMGIEKPLPDASVGDSSTFGASPRVGGDVSSGTNLTTILGILLLLAGVVVGSIWLLSGTSGEDVPRPVIEEPPAEDSAAEQPAMAPEPQDVEIEEPQQTGQPLDTSEFSDDSLPRETTEAPPLSEQTVAAPPEPAPMPETRVVTLLATEAVWMEARYANGEAREFTLVPGDTLRLTFEQALTLRFGNAGGVSLKLDGNPYPLNAVSGQVKTIRLP